MLSQLVQHPAKIPPEEIARLVGYLNPLVLELGCHDGSDTALMLAAMPRGHFCCFEPDERPRARFWDNVPQTDHVELDCTAVADVDGVKQFYASTGEVNDCPDWDYSGSLQQPTRHLTRSPEVKFKEPVQVDCTRLDTWLDRRVIGYSLEYIDFIWADVQGGQRGLIAGGRLALALTRWLYIECHVEPLYDQEPKQDELVALLPGFEPLAVYEQDSILFKNRHFP